MMVEREGIEPSIADVQISALPLGYFSILAGAADHDTTLYESKSYVLPLDDTPKLGVIFKGNADLNIKREHFIS